MSGVRFVKVSTIIKVSTIVTLSAVEVQEAQCKKAWCLASDVLRPPGGPVRSA
ncbi:hypothetical protein FHS68_000645 [Dyadobacter arcticus]|uniref:Uncharacterized protein n=1 Tax=Dyadobacter arcticus TaxID=1078754 RepID=A0ABX0UHJ3_9BACT|nr:hypothetical protein [Dyadobacter arcticus]